MTTGPRNWLEGVQSRLAMRREAAGTTTAVRGHRKGARLGDGDRGRGDGHQGRPNLLRDGRGVGPKLIGDSLDGQGRRDIHAGLDRGGLSKPKVAACE